MAKILNLDEMLEIITFNRWEEAPIFKALLEATGTQMAKLIAERLGVQAGPTKSQGIAFGGTSSSFWQKTEGQELPEEIAELGLDEEGDWEMPVEGVHVVMDDVTT